MHARSTPKNVLVPAKDLGEPKGVGGWFEANTPTIDRSRGCEVELRIKMAPLVELDRRAGHSTAHKGEMDAWVGRIERGCETWVIGRKLREGQGGAAAFLQSVKGDEKNSAMALRRRLTHRINKRSL